MPRVTPPHISLAKKVRPRHTYKTIRLSLEDIENTPPQGAPDYNAFISASKFESYEAGSAKYRRVAVKDNIATTRMNFPTTCGSRILKTYQSPFEATAAEQLHKEKKFLVGKTNLDEFGMGSHSMNSYFGPVRRPRPLGKFSVGGSSGGSAVAVSTDQCFQALGTDTGGSVRLPAAYTGVVGFKPSYGRISRWGVIPYANSLDTVGVIGRSVSSVYGALSPNIMSHDARDPTSLTRNTRLRMYEARKRFFIQSGSKQPMDFNKIQAYLQNDFGRLKIGLPTEYNIAELDPVVREEWKQALTLFQEHGCTLVPVSLPNTKHALSAYYVIAAAEAASNLSKYDGVRYGTRADVTDGAGDILYSRTRGDGFGDEVKRRILLGSYSLSSKAIDNYFIKAQKVRRLVQRDFDRVFSLPNLLKDEEQFDLSEMDESIEMDNKLGPPQVDFIVCPTAPTLPPTRNMVKKQSSVDSYMNDVFTVPSSLAGLPAISLPFKLPDKDGFAGIQLIGQYADDFRLLITAKAVESLQRRKASIIRKHFSWGPIITKVPVGGDILRKYPSPKGDRREPRTEKEIDLLVEGAFEDWDSIMSSKTQPR